MKQTVVGVFDRYAAAEQAATALRSRGIDPDCIHVTSAEMASGSSTTSTSTTSTESRDEGGVLSGVKNFFSDLFSDDDKEVGNYAEAVRRGGAVVKVEVEDDPEADIARETLEDAGAVDIDEQMAAWSGSSTSPGDTTAASLNQTARTGTTGDDVIPVIREDIAVGKRTVQAGGVRVYSRLVSENVSESVTLREERAVVERRPVDRPASAADLADLGDRTIEVTESVERPVVEKTARVVEEVVVGKEVRNREATIDGTVRHTEVTVEQIPGELTGSQSYRSDFDTRYAGQNARYEDYEPAYQFGQGLRSDQRYQGRNSWNDVEADAKSDWTTRYPNDPWDRVKDAARHSWERLTS